MYENVNKSDWSLLIERKTVFPSLKQTLSQNQAPPNLFFGTATIVAVMKQVDTVK